MSATAYVEEARNWAHALTRSASRFPGDYGPAMKRVARQVGVPAGVLWRLRYRVPKTINVEHYAALGAAYADEQRYREQRREVVARTPLGQVLLCLADRLAGQEAGAVE